MSGRVAVVTGAGRGIGRALAVALLESGAQVVAVSRTEHELQSLVQESSGRAPAARWRVCDVSDAAQVAELAHWLEKEYGRVDVLVNNAGLRMIHVGSRGGYKVSLEELPVEDWDRMIAVNLRGPFLTCKLLLPLLRQGDESSVINISAGGGAAGEAGRAPYCASKAGLEALTQSVAAEWRPYNITVNTVSPGVSVFTDEIKREMRRQDPTLRHARPAMMAPAVLYLASPEARGVTGRRIVAWQWLAEHDLGGWDEWLAE